MKEVIKTHNLTKTFGKVKAVDGVSLKINKGEIYGFLGLNGAGKTTTIRMLLGMINPTKGDSFLYNKKVNADSYGLWSKVGYIVETPYSYPDLTVIENLEIIRRLRQTPKSSVDDIINKLRLTSYKDRKAKYLSLGNAQRLGLAKALLHNPEILILDEPTNGLDPAGIVEIRELLKDLASKGVTIFISSHILGEMSKLANRIGIIHEGRLVQEVNSHQLERLLNKRVIIDTLNKKTAKKILEEVGFAVNLSVERFLEIKDKKAINHPEKIANILVNANIPLTLLKVEEENLESYFLRIIGVKK